MKYIKPELLVVNYSVYDPIYSESIEVPIDDNLEPEDGEVL